jgi:hypothetical protein
MSQKTYQGELVCVGKVFSNSFVEGAAAFVPKFANARR